MLDRMIQQVVGSWILNELFLANLFVTGDLESGKGDEFRKIHLSIFVRL